jgi:maltose O-acetyltransferase
MNEERTEKVKMLAGEPYDAWDPELTEERNRAKNLCYELNQTSPLNIERRKKLAAQIIGRDDAILESPFHCDYGYNLKVGKGFYANHGCTILDCNLITIGDNCLLAPHVVISAATHPLDAEARAAGVEFTAPISLGNNCWLGANSTIIPGVVLGDGVVVGAGAVVTKSFPSNVVVAGVPAKIIRYVDDDDEVQL